MKQLWEYTAVDRFGHSRKYQAYASSETQAQTLEHLQGTLKGLRITSLERVPDSAYRPPTGMIQSDAFEHGYYRGAMTELGHRAAPFLSAQRKLITRRPIIRASIIPRPHR